VTTLLLAAAGWTSGALGQAPAGDFQVVVHPSNPASAVDRRFLSQVFLRKTTHWESGESTRPVDLPADSETRRRFSEVIHGRSVAAVKNYWQQIIFAGRGVPPPELESDEAVLRHVTRWPGAVGYVSAGAELRGARVLTVR
jgi:ABC-type phosphate transport system substrate-binding protein